MLALLLLDEGSAITNTVFLLKAIPVVFLYVVALLLILPQGRFAEWRPLGFLCSCVLATIGIRIWPTHYSYQQYNTPVLIAAGLLFLPLLLVSIVYLASRETPKQKLVVSGVPLTSEDETELQARLTDRRMAVEVLETATTDTTKHLLFQDHRPAAYKSGAVLSQVLAPVYAQLRPLIAYVQSQQRIETIGLEMTLVEEQGWQLRLYLVAPIQQLNGLLEQVDAIPRKQLRAGRVDSVVRIDYREGHPLNIMDTSSDY
ncbi:hypothetical protein [Hymenobacter volaticus]|uniref:DUF4153 domain-containing protein n=1 Tax=Hymenobacter volaticus TaxID=2932254 RepID=A0ABY4GDP1_9BACT|nr:hypothetical protein [Hymenobacter volaticus]UOQ69030.1 hypothetical protein MUN86_26365 [Hymenobacter volaticus]